jgi:hypothetical protein
MMNLKALKSLFPVLGMIIISLSSCEKEEGTSSCPDHYTGSSCQEQITPSKMFITKIEVVKFPDEDPNGTVCSAWDCTGGRGADLYLTVGLTSASSPLWTSTIVNYDADPNTSYSYYPSPLVELEPKSSYAIRALDEDVTTSDYVGGITFTPYSSTGGFPESKTLDVGTGLVLKVSFIYEF